MQMKKMKNRMLWLISLVRRHSWMLNRRKTRLLKKMRNMWLQRYLQFSPKMTRLSVGNKCKSNAVRLFLFVNIAMTWWTMMMQGSREWTMSSTKKLNANLKKKLVLKRRILCECHRVGRRNFGAKIWFATRIGTTIYKTN